MEAHTRETRASLELIESVRCLECGIVYAKPARGGIAEVNPGCPECGYVGWISASIPFSPEGWRPRSAADLRLLPHARSG